RRAVSQGREPRAGSRLVPSLPRRRQARPAAAAEGAGRALASSTFAQHASPPARYGRIVRIRTAPEITFVALNCPNAESDTGRTAGTEVTLRGVRFRLLLAQGIDIGSSARLGPRCILTVP